MDVIELLTSIDGLPAGARLLARRHGDCWVAACNGRDIVTIDAREIGQDAPSRQRTAEDIYGAARLDQYALAPAAP